MPACMLADDPKPPSRRSEPKPYAKDALLLACERPLALPSPRCEPARRKPGVPRTLPPMYGELGSTESRCRPWDRIMALADERPAEGDRGAWADGISGAGVPLVKPNWLLREGKVADDVNGEREGVLGGGATNAEGRELSLPLPSPEVACAVDCTESDSLCAAVRCPEEARDDDDLDVCKLSDRGAPLCSQLSGREMIACRRPENRPAAALPV